MEDQRFIRVTVWLEGMSVQAVDAWDRIKAYSSSRKVPTFVLSVREAKDLIEALQIGIEKENSFGPKIPRYIHFAH